MKDSDRPVVMKKITTSAEKYVSPFETNEICQETRTNKLLPRLKRETEFSRKKFEKSIFNEGNFFLFLILEQKKGKENYLYNKFKFIFNIRTKKKKLF